MLSLMHKIDKKEVKVLLYERKRVAGGAIEEGVGGIKLEGEEGIVGYQEPQPC